MMNNNTKAVRSELMNTNQVKIAGRIDSELAFSHEVFGEGFYTTDVVIKRLSGTEDRIPVVVSDRLIDVSKDHVGQCIYVEGQLRSYNCHEGERTHLQIFVFAQTISLIKEEDKVMNTNLIFLNGCICKTPVHRETPMQREITDLLLAVNRAYGKSDYLPCICWGRNARYAAGLPVGTYVKLQGRIQSREYIKQINETESEIRIAYEVSVNRVEQYP